MIRQNDQTNGTTSDTRRPRLVPYTIVTIDNLSVVSFFVFA